MCARVVTKLYEHIEYIKLYHNIPSQINERQSSHETCTRVAAEGVDPDDTIAELEVEGHGSVFNVLPPREEERGGGGALQCRHEPITVSAESSDMLTVV